MLSSKYVNKHQTNTDNNRGTITIHLCGLASGVDDPRFYLVKAEKIDIQTFKGDFEKKHKVPPGSKVIPTPNAYTTNKVWNNLAPDFSKVLRDILIIKEYTELWMFLILDGYVSHMQGDALKICADYKILIVKEEGDTSQVCQTYDKDVSLRGKRHHRHFLNGIRISVNMVIQYALIIVENKVCTFCVLFYLSVTN